jgi:hypothetical protein
MDKSKSHRGACPIFTKALSLKSIGDGRLTLTHPYGAELVFSKSGLKPPGIVKNRD